MLALKYRPRHFDDMIGQDHITRTLSRIIRRAKTGDIKLPNVLIFAGCRGSGKTTSARIVGMALNCPEPTAPCGECPTCIDILESRATNVFEIDSASNGSVEAVKQVISQVRYGVDSGYQVIIYDEAHALSRPAFNSMLKPLEDGIPNTVFVLCTTEQHRIPVPVLSRSMVFVYMPIQPIHIMERLAYVMKRENIPFDAEVIELIAQESGGAMRDALMLADQLNQSYGDLTLEGYRELFGDDPGEMFARLIDSLYDFDAREIDAAVDALMRRVVDPQQLVERWIEFELKVLKRQFTNFRYPQSEGDALMRLELLWFLTDKIRALSIGSRALIRACAILMSARLTRRILDTEEAMSLLGM